jgi:hypothetical protein
LEVAEHCLEENNVRFVGQHELADGLHPNMHHSVFAGPDVVRQKLHLPDGRHGFRLVVLTIAYSYIKEALGLCLFSELFLNQSRKTKTKRALSWRSHGPLISGYQCKIKIEDEELIVPINVKLKSAATNMSAEVEEHFRDPLRFREETKSV